MEKYLINKDVSLIEGLCKLDKLSDDALTLFVVDTEGCMCGTLTDGDLRRYLIAGGKIEDCISKAMHIDFSFLEADEKNALEKVHTIKDKGIVLLPVLDEQKHILHIYNLKNYRSLLPVDAVLMAGGKGERLRPLTEKTPKPLLKVGDKAIIDYNIERLISFGISHLSVTVNYLKEQIEEHFSNPINGVQVTCVREPQYLGTIGSVRFVSQFYNDVVLVMNSDLFTNINYEDFYLHFKEYNADMAIAAVPYSISVPYGIFELEGRCIQGIKEKPTYNYYANAGIYLIKKELFKYIPENAFYNATDFVELLIRNKKNVIRYPITGYWLDIGKHEEYQKAQELVKHL